MNTAEPRDNQSSGTGDQNVGGANAPEGEEKPTVQSISDFADYFSGHAQGMPVQSLVTSHYATLEGMIEHIHDHPFCGQHYFESPKLASVINKFESFGTFPLSFQRVNAGGTTRDHLEFAINPFEHPNYHDFDTLCITLDDYVLPLLNDSFNFGQPITREGLSLLVLDPKEFRALSHYVTNREARRSFISSIDDDSNGRDAFHALLIKAIKARASDIHIEPITSNETRIRYRIDGVLHDQNYSFTLRRLRSIVSALKVDANLDIAEKRKPQDGGIKFIAREKNEGKSVNQQDDQQNASNFNVKFAQSPELHERTFRVSTMPAEYGEKGVVRIMTRKEQIDLDQLGFAPGLYETLHKRIHVPQGLILVTGPTGSGKSTTLYSFLQILNTEAVNIVTIEDPVEVSIPGITQSYVNRAIQWDFQTALRSFLRQDPDIILVGEIRDAETAQTAIEAAKTGHLVFSTLHTNDAIGALLRLKELGVDNSDLYTCLQTVMAQRLVRRLNPDHSVEEDIAEQFNRLIGESAFSSLVVRKPREGLTVEDSYGYHGRIPIAEFWNLDEGDRSLIFEGCKEHGLFLQAALGKGMQPLVLNGFEKVLNGETSLDELIRVVPSEEFFRFRDYFKKMVRDRNSGDPSLTVTQRDRPPSGLTS